jgi:hypothetical protein
MIASAKTHADENENTVRRASAPIILIGGAVRVMSRYFAAALVVMLLTQCLS